MSRPAGSKNKVKTNIVNKTDGYANAVMGTGTSRDRSSFNRVQNQGLLDNLTLNNLYLSNGFAKRVVDIYPEEMTRAGFEIEDLENEDLEEYIQSQCQVLNVTKHLANAVRWARLLGGSIMVLGINDGGTLDEPVNENTIKDFEFIRVYDRWQVNISERFADPSLPNYGEPAKWLISPMTGAAPYYVHNSRVHVFDGGEVPDLIRSQNDGWGTSALQDCFKQLERLGMSHQYTMMLLERMQQAIHKIPDLASILMSPNGEASIQKRVDLVDMVRGILNTIVIDSAEDYDLKSASLGGIHEVLDRFAEALSAVTGIPVPILFGKSQGGLSNTSKGETDAWNARIEAAQQNILREPLDKIITYIIKAKTKEDPPYELCFKPLAIMSELEEKGIEKIEAETDKLKMETAKGYVEIAALSNDEVRLSIAEKYEIDATLTIEPLSPDDDLPV